MSWLAEVYGDWKTEPACREEADSAGFSPPSPAPDPGDFTPDALSWLAQAFGIDLVAPQAEPVPPAVPPFCREPILALPTPPPDPAIQRLVALLPPTLTERYQERAAVREYDGGLFRHEAELAALTDLVPHVPAPFDAEIWNTLAARGPVKGADKRVWAARMLDQLERHTGLSNRISWPLFLRLERLEEMRQA